MGQVQTFGALWRRYRVSIIFPVLSFSAIIADYSHTQKFKKSLKALSNKREELNN